MKLAQSKSQAECNLSMEPKLKAAKARLVTTHNEAEKTKSEVELLKAKLDSVSENRSLDTVSVLLQAAAQDAEDKSEVRPFLHRQLAVVTKHMNSTNCCCMITYSNLAHRRKLPKWRDRR